MKFTIILASFLLINLPYFGLCQKTQPVIRDSIYSSIDQPGILEIKQYKSEQDLNDYNPYRTQHKILKKSGEISNNISNFYLESFFSEGLAIASDRIHNKKVFIDENFKKVIEYKGLNYSFTNFSDGVAWVKNETSDPFLINKKNEILFRCIGCTQVNSFSEGLAAFSDENEQWGILDKSGKTLFKLPKEIFYVSKFSSGMAQYYVKNPNISNLNEVKFGYLNRAGETIIKPLFTYMEDIGNIDQLIAGDDDEKNRFNGEFANIVEYKTTSSTKSDNQSSELEINYLINKKGDIITENSSIHDYKNSLFYLKPKEQKSKIGYVNSQNKFVINPIYDEGYEFSNGFAVVLLGKKSFIINNKGKTIFEFPKYENLTRISFYDKPNMDYVEGGGLGLVNVLKSKQIINGLKTLEEYYDNGTLKIKFKYIEPFKPYGTYLEFYKNGNLKIKKTNQSINNAIECEESFFENGKIRNRGCYSSGPYTEIGLHESYYENGNLSKKTNYSELYPGEKIGLSLEYFETGEIMSQLNYLKGKRHGEYFYYDSPGNLSSNGFYKNGELDGIQIEYFGFGLIKSKTNYKNGQINGLKELFNVNHKLEERSNWKNGFLDGFFEKYDYKGENIEKGNYVQGKKNGQYTVKINDIAIVCNYYLDQLNGPYYEFWANGKVKISTNYIYGKESGSHEEFNEQGTLVLKYTL